MIDGALCYPFASCTDVPLAWYANTAAVIGLVSAELVSRWPRRSLWRLSRRLQQRWGWLPEADQ